MYGTYDQMGMSQQGYAAMQPASFSSKEELKQHASAYVQQQLAMMGHPPTSRHTSGGGSSSRHADSAYGMQGIGYSEAGWQGGYDSTGAAPAAAAAAAGGPKKSGRGRGRPPGSKNQTHSNANVSAAVESAAAAAVAAAAAAEQQLYQQQQYSMNARISQDEAATWCSTGMMLTGSAAAGAPHGSPGGEVHSSATYMLPQHMQQGSAAPALTAAGGQDPNDPAARAAAPVPLNSRGMDPGTEGMTGEMLHHAADGGAAAAGPECTGLLPSCAATAAELNRLPQFRVSMSGLDFELEAAAGGSSCVRFSERTLRLFTGEEAAAMPAGCKASISSLDFPDQFRHSLTSLDMDLLGNNAANRMSEHTHIALRGPSWDGAGSSPRSQPPEVPADGTAAAAPAAAATEGGRAAAPASGAGYMPDSIGAETALAAAFTQRRQQEAPDMMLPPASSGMVQQTGTWAAPQQPTSSAAAAGAATAAPAAPAGLSPSLNSIHTTGSFTFPAAMPAQDNAGAAIHPGAFAAAAEAPVPLEQGAPSSSTPFGAVPIQLAPFSPVEDDAVLAGPSALPADLVPSSGMMLKIEDQGQGSQPIQMQLQPLQQQQACGLGAGVNPGFDHVLPAHSQPPAAPRMPPAFHSVLQALQPPASGPSSGGSAAVVASMGMGYIHASEPQQQHRQQPQQHGCDSVLAAASPAIMGICAHSSACPPSMGVSGGFMLPACAAGPQQLQQQAMPMPIPPQLLMLPPQHQQAPGGRVSDLAMGPLPSPIDLFNGDHGLHTSEDLLIGTDEVFDERLLGCAGSSQHHQHHHQQQLLHAAMHGMLLHAGHWVQHGAAMHAGHMQHHHAGMEAAAGAPSTAGPCTGLPAERHDAAALHSAHAGGLQTGAGAVGQQDQPDASARQGVKRRRSSGNGSAWTKKARPSEGSLVEIHGAGHHHGVDDCLHFWDD